MEGTPRVVGGTVLAALVLMGSVTASAAGQSRVLEGEFLRGGKVVRDAGAARGRALLLHRGALASRDFTMGALRSVIVRARGTGLLSVSVDGVAQTPIRLTRGYHEHTLHVDLPAGKRRLALRSKRGRAIVDRVRLRPSTRRPAPPAAPPAAAPQGEVLAERRHSVPLGSSIILEKLTSDAAYDAAFRTHFSSLTPENELKMDWVHPQRGRFEFAAADALLAYAERHGKTVRGHTLIFGKQTPPWVWRLLFSTDAEQAMREHITTVMQRYKGRIREWDVVNEAFEDDGSYRYNAWYEKLGPRYVELAFQIAREVDPSARLYYNEINAEVTNRRRSAVITLAKELKAKGLIDGIGLQMHTHVQGYPHRVDLERTMRLYEEMGLTVQITEMDVHAGEARHGTVEERLAKQAQIYREAAEACAAVLACERFTVWGVSDRYSWIGADHLPLLLDRDFRPKPAYAAVRDALGG